MKTLYLLRHAKAETGDSAQLDHARPLAERGRRDAQALGEWMHQYNMLPQKVLCSSSVRTTQTLDLLSRSWQIPVAVDISPDLYLAAAPDILQLLQQTDSRHEILLVVGHNPGLHHLCLTLTSGSQSRGMMEVRFPTCALAVISYEIEQWDMIAPAAGRLALFREPDAN